MHFGPPEQVVLVDPVVEEQPEDRDDGADGQQCRVQEHEPHRLDDLAEALAQIVLFLFHELVGLVLRHVLRAVLELALDDPGDPEGVHHPEEGDEHCAHHEHYRLLVDDALRMHKLLLFQQQYNCLYYN